jgi:hypothetical protein
MKSLVVMNRREDLLLIRDLLSPYKFLELQCQNFFSARKFDLLITDKFSLVSKVKSPIILTNCEHDERKDGIVMCRFINRSAIDFIVELHEKDTSKKSDFNISQKFSEKLLNSKERIFFTENFQKNQEYFQSFKNKRLLEVVNYLHTINLESFTCKIRKSEILFITDKKISQFILHNYFERVRKTNEKYYMFFQL